MMPAASRPTTTNRAMGPHARPWLTLTGTIGGRPPPPFPPPPLAVLFVAAPLVEVPRFAPAAGRVDGRRLPPACGVLMPIGSRRDRFRYGRARGCGTVPGCDQLLAVPSRPALS